MVGTIYTIFKCFLNVLFKLVSSCRWSWRYLLVDKWMRLAWQKSARAEGYDEKQEDARHAMAKRGQVGELCSSLSFGYGIIGLFLLKLVNEF